ncbi:MAG: DUF1810 domain-containing protein [Geobacteraceae bacterium]|nr:DUF1810 domain-containing protein [Geobacteraceae bacterium]
MEMNNKTGRNDPFGLNRFTEAQERVYDTVISELKSGQKRSHWMWFIFPQIVGLGHSATSVHYSIKSAGEARAYLDHPVLGGRLVECSKAILAVEGRPASAIFGYPDDMKLKSSMTLFAAVAEDPHSVFAQVLDKYFQGERDSATLEILKKFE